MFLIARSVLFIVVNDSCISFIVVSIVILVLTKEYSRLGVAKKTMSPDEFDIIRTDIENRGKG